MTESTFNAGTILPIATLNKDGTPPPMRIASASSARNLIGTYNRANEGRAWVNARYKGLVDGNPPFSQKILKENGQAWRHNFNTMEPKGILSGACTPFYDLFSGAKEYLYVETEFGDSAQRVEWSRIISSEASRSISEWTGFDFQMQQMIPECVGYGKGFICFEDKFDPHFKSVPQSRFRFPDGAECLPEKWDDYGIVDYMRVEELWNKIRNKAVARKAGWNIEATTTAIINAIPRTVGDAQWVYDYDFLQQRVKDSDVLDGIRASTIGVYHVFVKEFDGKVSRMIVAIQGNEAIQGIGGTPTDGFLFKAPSEYDSFEEMTIPFIFETGDGSINGTQGLFRQYFDLMNSKIRLINGTFDFAMLRNSLVLQAKSAGSYDDVNLIQLGITTIIPPEFSVQQSSIMGDMEGPLLCNRVADNIINSNTGVYRSEGHRLKGNPESATQAALDHEKEAKLASSAINRFYGFMDKLYVQWFNRMSNTSLPSSSNPGIKMARTFQDRCKKRGVPEEALRRIRSIRACRVIGNGSVYARKEALNGMGPAIGFMPEQGKQNWAKAVVAANSNQDMVDQLFPKAQADQVPQEQVHDAMVENAVLAEGMPIVLTSTQNDAVHLQIHFAAANASAASVSQGGNPQAVFTLCSAIQQHAQGHIQRLMGNPVRKDQVKQFIDQWKQLGQFVKQLGEHLKEQQQNAEANRQAELQAKLIELGKDPETRINAAVTQQKMVNTQRKADQSIALKNVKTAQDLQRARQSMALEDAKVAASINRATQESLASVGSEE